MKTLYLVRHAKSSWDDPLLDDFDRPLNGRGRKDAPKMGKRFRDRKIQPQLLVSSPAERAWSTATLIAEKLGISPGDIFADKRLYHAGEDELLSVVREMKDAHNVVMLFGHNPGLTDFANRLCSVPVTDNIPTCGVVCIRLGASSWTKTSWGRGEVDFYDFPKNR